MQKIRKNDEQFSGNLHHGRMDGWMDEQMEEIL